MKKFILLLALILTPLLCSCAYQNDDPINGMIDKIPAIFEGSTQAPSNESGFRKLYKKYAEQNVVNFTNAEKEMNNLLNPRYSYGVSAYNQSNGLSDTASMFFDAGSAEKLGLYFKLLGYSKREYNEDGSDATFTCEKDGSYYKYEATYDEEAQRFDIVVYKDEAVCEAFRCDLDGEKLNKIYYDGNIKRLIVSNADTEKNVEIKWYDTEFVAGFEIPSSEKTGYITYENGVLSGS